MLGRFLLLVALMGMLHAAFSTYEYLSHLKAFGRPEGFIPNSIILETLVALTLGIFGATLNAPPIKEISWASEMKKHQIDDIDSRLGFSSRVNRGTVMFRKRFTD